MAPPADSSTSKPRSLTFEEFSRVERALTTYIRDTEEDDEAGVIQGAVVTWYLSQQDISSEEQLISDRGMINSIIDRMVSDGTLVILEDDEEENEDAEEEQPQREPKDATIAVEERWIAVHPNYVIE